MLFYHGTSTKVLAAIARKGLLMEPPNKVYDWCDNNVFLTSYLCDATWWADRAVEKHGGKPVIIEVDPQSFDHFKKERDDAVGDEHHWRINQDIKLALNTRVRELPKSRGVPRYTPGRPQPTKRTRELREYIFNQPTQIITIAGTQRRFTMDAA